MAERVKIVCGSFVLSEHMYYGDYWLVFAMTKSGKTELRIAEGDYLSCKRICDKLNSAIESKERKMSS